MPFFLSCSFLQIPGTSKGYAFITFDSQTVAEKVNPNFFNV